MRQLTVQIIAIFFLMTAFVVPGNAAVRGGINYSIPVYYENLSEQELKIKSDVLFNTALNLEDGIINEDMTNALVIFSVLHRVNPEEYTYPMKLGILYDKAKKDKYAKGALFEAVGIKPSASEPYFYLGEFYYKRALYKPALKNYKKAYEKSTNPSYELLYKLGDIYEKLGDTKSSVFYLNKASILNPNSELDKKIQHVNTLDSSNQAYYRK